MTTTVDLAKVEEYLGRVRNIRKSLDTLLEQAKDMSVDLKSRIAAVDLRLAGIEALLHDAATNAFNAAKWSDQAAQAAEAASARAEATRKSVVEYVVVSTTIFVVVAGIVLLAAAASIWQSYITRKAIFAFRPV